MLSYTDTNRLPTYLNGRKSSCLMRLHLLTPRQKTHACILLMLLIMIMIDLLRSPIPAPSLKFPRPSTLNLSR
ncbi:MAG: hypothetical protein QOH39_10 [Verrucomicrobiota bacterium]